MRSRETGWRRTSRGRKMERQKAFDLGWALLGSAELLVPLTTAVAGLYQSVCICALHVGMYGCMYVCTERGRLGGHFYCRGHQTSSEMPLACMSTRPQWIMDEHLAPPSLLGRQDQMFATARFGDRPGPRLGSDSRFKLNGVNRLQSGHGHDGDVTGNGAETGQRPTMVSARPNRRRPEIRDDSTRHKRRGARNEGGGGLRVTHSAQPHKAWAAIHHCRNEQ
ncbi:hypothetical protein EDB81DRAFT_350094 [Dactylonectria macrodidyma]|uniref:Uncharacterized protein n=1 Tax=Dactylonectria macrodidyma TaxID=307937 RepID=A0A9P9FH79_9HYPO|nr:hypothetical protein EDB81DRAFT_350094 [Dactylonectria macrodidyma]